MTTPIVYHQTRKKLTAVSLARYGDNEQSKAENGQLWQRVAEGKRRA